MRDGVEAGRSDKGELRRESILRALENLLETTTLNELNVRDISKAAGVTRSAFYFYFENKAAAVSELSKVVDEEVAAASAIYSGGAADPAGQVEQMICAVRDTWMRHPHLFRAMRDARASDPGVDDLWNNGLEGFVEPVAAVIDSERAAARAPVGADSRMVALILLESIVRLGNRYWIGDQKSTDVAAATQALSEVWVGTIYGRH
ncbi:TetR/AcrR family transcriptional regulator [Rhodococcus sp. IEGM 1379]|uniref:TetR/AcrR family transcriptional regulator n=1 Tax=Rhodococcus sp. IEGM 1379 TaxID=3047086 RepID=UPI0024B646DB|nr:TetR/AcrR family transcriptional regulator [Rhodococcus sp. IEGM 1379]MDI9917153.1 TetR/AcrR family transcriptional regulator [Rhodococcus sp. IEGM 1379]